jgi:hypothetical protein
MEAATANEAELPPSEHLPRLTIFSLPDEILIQIATHLGGHGALPRLSRVNKYLHAIANAATAKNLVIHPRHVEHAIQWLARHFNLIECVKSVNIVPAQIRSPTKCDDLSQMESSQEVAELLREVIPAVNNQTLALDDLREGEPISGEVWTRDVKFFLGVLNMICLNLDTLEIQMPAAARYGRKPRHIPFVLNYQLPMVNIDCVPLSPIQGVAFDSLRNKLRSLTIVPHNTWAGPVKREILTTQIHVEFRSVGRGYIRLRGSNRLQHLDIPMEALGLPSSLRFQGPEGELVNVGSLA